MNKNVKVIPFKDLEHAYVIISFKEDKYGRGAEYFLSFLYDGGRVAAEWEPRYGPIQRWIKCDKDSPNAQEHYFYEYHNTPPGSWSQLAVETYGLVKELLMGHYETIFNILKDWTEE